MCHCLLEMVCGRGGLENEANGGGGERVDTRVERGTKSFLRKSCSSKSTTFLVGCRVCYNRLCSKRGVGVLDGSEDRGGKEEEDEM